MQGHDGRRAIHYDHGGSTGTVKERGMDMDLKCTGHGYAIYVNGRFEHWYVDQVKAYSDFEFLRDMLPDTEAVDLVDFLTGEVLASTVGWEHED